MVPSEDVRKFLKDFDSMELSRTLVLKYDKLVAEGDSQAFKSFIDKLKDINQSLKERVNTMPVVEKKRKRSSERDSRDKSKQRRSGGSRKSRSRSARRRSRDRSERKRP